MNNDQSGPWTTSPQPMQADVTALLEDNTTDLYSQPKEEIVIRELGQNAIDACIARQLLEPGIARTIEFEMHPLSNGRWLLDVWDDGIGVDPNDARLCFGTLGGSSKRPKDRDFANSPSSGHYGIGLKCALPVSGEITILSQKMTLPGEYIPPPFRFTAYANSRYEMHPVTEPIAPGTRVRVTLPSQCGPEWLSVTLQQYLLFTEGVRIICRTPAGESLVNKTPPWALNLTETEILKVAGDLFNGEEFAGAFRFAHDPTGTRGVALIAGWPVLPGSQPLARMYHRGIFVSNKVRGFAPPYGPFLSVALDSKLQVNTAREDLHGEEDRVESVCQAVGAALVEFLGPLGKTAPDRLRNIVLQQREAMLAGVEAGHTTLLSHLTRVLPLFTTLGYSTYEQILRRHGRVEYLEDEKDWHRVEMKAKQEGHCLVRADYRDTNQLLKVISQHWHGAPARALSAVDYLSRFARPTDALGLEEQRLMRIAEAELRAEQCCLAFAESDEPYEPALLEMEDEESIRRHLQASDQDDANPVKTVKTLRLNRSHPLVEKLLTAPDLPEEQFRAWIRLIYHHALLSAGETPTGGESRRQARALMVLFNATGGSF